MKTEDELIGFVLDYFRSPGSGQDYNADEVAFVRKYVPGAVEDMNRRLGLYIADSDQVPDEQAHWVAVAIANLPPIAHFFGVEVDAAAKAYAESMLSAQVDEDTTQPVEFTSF